MLFPTHLSPFGQADEVVRETLIVIFLQFLRFRLVMNRQQPKHENLPSV